MCVNVLPNKPWKQIDPCPPWTCVRVLCEDSRPRKPIRHSRFSASMAILIAGVTKCKELRQKCLWVCLDNYAGEGQKPSPPSRATDSWYDDINDWAWWLMSSKCTCQHGTLTWQLRYLVTNTQYQLLSTEHVVPRIWHTNACKEVAKRMVITSL